MAALCPPANGTYPAQFTWDPTQTTVKVRDATPADGLTPRIEQHRVINGTDTVVAVYSSFSSNPYTCSEIFQTIPTQPAPGQPFTAAQMAPYTPAQLQTMADMGCGPFGNVAHHDDFRRWLPGDTFLVYPAVYTTTQTANGPVSNNNVTLEPLGDYRYYCPPPNGNQICSPVYSPNNITIEGVTQHGIRPVIIRNDEGAGAFNDSETPKDVVEIQGGANDTIDDISVELGPNGYVYSAGIYLIHVGYNDYDSNGNPLTAPILGASPNQTTIQHLRVSGFEQAEARSGGANGIQGDTLGGGTVVINYNEIDHNGGSGVQNYSGLGHGVYIDASSTAEGNSTYDPNFTVLASNNWFHDQYYGHDLKSRAQKTTLVGNYFQEGVPQGGTYTIADSFNADIPNGGVLTARNNIFVKNAAGYPAGQYGLAYGEEGFPTSPYDGPNGGLRTNSINIIFNTFVAFAQTVDGTHPLLPFEFFNPAQLPGSPGFPVKKVTVDSNAFVGYCPTGDATQDFRGTTALVAGFADLSQAFSFGGQWLSPVTSDIGQFTYKHVAAPVKRTNAAVGAED